MTRILMKDALAVGVEPGSDAEGLVKKAEAVLSLIDREKERRPMGFFFDATS